MIGHIKLLLLLLLFSAGRSQRTVQSEPQCLVQTYAGEQEGVLVPAEECTTFREQRKNGSATSSQADQHVCCPVFRSDRAICGQLSQNADAFSNDSRETKLDQFRWAVMILSRWVESIACSGSLITNHHVLSAAHCFVAVRGKNRSASDYRVRLGEWDLYADEDCMYVRGQLLCNSQPPIERRIADIIIHAGFKRIARDILHDIALVKLTAAVEYGEQIGPACLPSWVTDVPQVLGRNFTVTGWGRTRSYMSVKRKMKIEMPGRNVSACAVAYGLQQPEVPWIHLCVGGGRAGWDVCHGDSGSSLMQREQDRWVVVGTVSFGALKCGTPLPGVYTNIAYYIDWIQWAIDKSWN
uniref:Peptidase S1 domain-containing protein n=1 Tax=Anopheles dirus TaxID=7168 RepID=A0A182NC21_9DIPT